MEDADAKEPTSTPMKSIPVNMDTIIKNRGCAYGYVNSESPFRVQLPWDVNVSPHTVPCQLLKE
jgi:hypothetical protein